MQHRLGLNLVCLAQAQGAGVRVGGWGRDKLQRDGIWPWARTFQSVHRQGLALSTKYLGPGTVLHARDIRRSVTDKIPAHMDPTF